MTNRIILSSNYSPWSPYSGGGQRSTHHLAEALSDLGYDLHVIFTKTRYESITPPSDLPYQLHWAEFTGLKSDRKNWFRRNSGKAVAKLVSQLLEPGAVYHANGEESSHIGKLKTQKAFPFVLTPRYPHIPEKVGRIKPTTKNAVLNPSLSKYILLGKSLNDCDIYCPTSKFAVSLYRDVYAIDDKPFDVVPNGIPDEFINLEVDQKSPSKNRIIFFGRLSKEKGVETLLDAATLIPESINELVFIGRGELASKVDAAHQEGPLTGKIQRLDWLSISELIIEIQRSTLAVLPSFEESFGNAIVEAMACGVPVISTNAGSIPEIVDANQNGILVNPGDPKALSEQIKLLIQDPEKRALLAKNGRQKVIENYSWKATAEKYAQIYSDLLDGHIR
ncbi:MAG: glycosyltransferase family 4 protein [Balneolaceae bacterium]|nr:glycosyltransferase family 4 protein [Balneolaceae bacterium]